MNLKKKTTRQLSTAVGLLAFTAFIIQGLGSTWGFEAIAKQLTQTTLLFVGGINIYFLGITSQKNNDDKKKEDDKKEDEEKENEKSK